MEEKKTITITREEFRERLTEASAEIISDAMKADADMGICTMFSFSNHSR